MDSPSVGIRERLVHVGGYSEFDAGRDFQRIGLVPGRADPGLDMGRHGLHR